MRRGSATVLLLVVVGLVVWWLGWLPVAVGILVVVVILGLLFVLSPRAALRFTAPPRHPGDGIGVKSPESGITARLRTDEYLSIIDTVELAEQRDPVVRRVVENIAVLHAEGVPRDFVRVPDEEVDGVLNRLCDAGLLTTDGNRVVMDPTVAFAVRRRVQDEGRVPELIATAGDVLSAHALSARMRANEMYFDRSIPADSEAVADHARALLDQVVALAWHTQYTSARALHAILQCNAALAELGQLDDAVVLAKQMAALCARRLGPHPVAAEAAESVAVISRMRRDGCGRS